MLNTNTKRIEFYRKMKKRRRRTYTVLIFITIIVSLMGIFLYKEYRKESVIKYLVTVEDENIDISYLKDIRKDYEEKLNIIEPNYNSSQKLEGGNSPEVIVFHHTAANGLTPEEINRNHISQGWGAIGYHFYIRKDGKIYRGRPEESVGAHAIGRNRTSIGICLEGNFEEERLTDAQKESLERLSVDMIIKYNLEDCIGHRNVCETLCPGKNFPMDNIKQEIAQRIIELNNTK
ncbi:MAG: peptidoglycan recognition family protein [Clostridiaceae bacterium]|nr:peptidoglycan recognition family protein [Clostridiaceae bacterium]